MDIKKLVKHMRQEAEDYRNGRTLGRAFADAEDVLDEAAEAIEQLQIGNQALRNSANGFKAESLKFRTELEQAQVEKNHLQMERDAAVEDLTKLCVDFDFPGCVVCKHWQGNTCEPVENGKARPCRWEWQGLKRGK